MRRASSWVMRAKSFGTKVPQDEASLELFFKTEPLPCDDLLPHTLSPAVQSALRN